MRVDASKSAYHEAPDARDEFNRSELRRARFLLRRLRFLEAKAAENKQGAHDHVFTELEIESLEWVLGPDGIDFLAKTVKMPA